MDFINVTVKLKAEVRMIPDTWLATITLPTGETFVVPDEAIVEIEN